MVIIEIAPTFTFIRIANTFVTINVSQYYRLIRSREINPCAAVTLNPLTAKLFNLNFHPLEVVFR